MFFFLFKQKTAYEMRISDWSSDVCSSDLKLRGKARIVIQRGRLAKMRRTPKVAAVLDQFVREVDIDEATGSWHPKAALIKLRAGDGTAPWRLWKIGRAHSDLQSLMRSSYAVFCLKKKHQDPDIKPAHAHPH